MNFLSVFFTAIGLSMDAFAVALSMGMLVADKKQRNEVALKAGLFFGGFQGIMPLIGWLLGKNFTEYITAIDHWIAFILLGIIGGKMIIESLKGEDDEAKLITSNKQFTILAIATSIDALAVGISFAFLKVNIFTAVMEIGIITCVLSILAAIIGKKFGDKLKGKAELIGGIILVLIGTKILLEHLGVF